VQLVSHLAPPAAAHWLFGHELESGVLHDPAPLQVDAVVTLPLTQVAAVQTVLSSGNVQVFALTPSHMPAQVPVPPQASRGPTGTPLTALQMPSESGCLHDSHWPSHSVSQHNPSTQCPVEHSASILQAMGSEPPVSMGESITLASLPLLPPDPLLPMLPPGALLPPEPCAEPPEPLAPADPVRHFPRLSLVAFTQREGLVQPESSMHSFAVSEELKQPEPPTRTAMATQNIAFRAAFFVSISVCINILLQQSPATTHPRPATGESL